MSMILGVRGWLQETTPRWVAMALVGWMAGSTILYGEDLMNRQGDQAERGRYSACVYRATTRSDVRAAFVDLYDFVDEIDDASGEPERTTPLRDRLDENFPPLDPANC